MRFLSGIRPAVLIVEDEALVAYHIALLVRRFQCDILGPVSGLTQAFEILAHKQPDGAILDIQLRRDETTYPVAAELRRRGVPFTFVTAYVSHAIDPAYRDEMILEKPISDNALCGFLERLKLTKRDSRVVRGGR